MWIEWAVGCSTAQKVGSGWEVSGLGQTGFMASEGDLPRLMQLRLFVCVRMEEGDEEGRAYSYEVTVETPYGPLGPVTGGFLSEPSTGPKLIEPERFYDVVPVEVNVASPGQYRVILSDAMGERAVVPYYFAVLPPLEDL